MRLVVQSNVLKPFKKESVCIIRRWNKKKKMKTTFHSFP